MAHCDYNCCAICDYKLDYNPWDARTKEDICDCCREGLAKRGIIVGNVDDLLKWIQQEEPKKLKRILKALSFRRCRYINDIDIAVYNRGIKFDDRGYIA